MDISNAIVATGALGMAAYGLVDGLKIFPFMISTAGWPFVRGALQPFEPALVRACADWEATVKANWMNGMPKDDQSAAAKSLIRLGLSPENAAKLAPAGHVDPARLTAVMQAVESGTPLAPQDVALLARFDASIDAALTAGFERGDQRYRSTARVWAGGIAVLLSVVAAKTTGFFGEAEHPLAEAILVGLVAVPLAPVAKDVASALTTAAGALKGWRS